MNVVLRADHVSPWSVGWKGKATLDDSLNRITKFDNERKDAGRAEGVVIPKPRDLILGEAREFDLAIMHIDINGFKEATGKMKMRGITRFLSIYLTEMTYLVKEFEGEIESYSGDRVTALFGAGQDKEKACQSCLDCGLTMITAVQFVLNPYLVKIGLPAFNCSVGMDYGETWIERVGIRGENQLTLVGHSVSIASQLQEISKPNHILLAHLFFTGLSLQEQKLCTRMEPDSSWRWTWNSGQAYPYYDYTGFWPDFKVVK